MPPIEDYQRWRRLPPVGCMFARVMALRPAAYDQVMEIAPAAGTLARVADAVAARIDELVADKSVAAVALLFPEIQTLDGIAQVMLALGKLPLWGVTPEWLDNEIVGKMVALRVARDIPFGAVTCPSEVLVLGPFNEFPPTRRSPITAMEMFVGEPLTADPKTGQLTTKANLAHMNPRKIMGDHGFDKTWTNSEKGREASLGTKHDNRARARVALVMPITMAKRLGCAP